MDWCTLLEYLVLGYVLVQLVRIFLGDCDLQLQWAERFGVSTGVLARKVVWITGASSGIGEHLAYVLAEAGSRLVLSARREEELQRVKKECLKFGTLQDDDIIVLPLDMLQFDKHRPAYEKIVQRFGQVDILVNNAGRTQRAAWEKTDLEVDRQMLELNVLSVLSLTKVVLPDMIQRKSGHIVNMSSLAGKLDFYILTWSKSSAVELLYEGWFDCLRIEVFHQNIAVTNLCPGPVFSNILKNSFTEKNGEILNEDMRQGDKRMTTARCARLCCVAIANKLDEVWISRNPALLAVYGSQYMPTISTWMFKTMGLKLAARAREGR